MEVSIIIPVYNVAPYIEDCLKSVMRQTFTGQMECLVVDDCGTDDSIPIAERLIADYDGSIRFEILHHERNRGLSAARNTGIEKAVGEYIFFVDSDDEITEDCIEKMMAIVKKNSEVEMVQGTYEWDGDIKKYPCMATDSHTHAITNQCVRDSLYHYHLVTSPAWNKLLRRSFLIDNNLLFKEGVLYEDFLWKFFVLKYIENVYFISDVTYHYRKRSGSIMTGTDIRTSAHHFSVDYKEIVTNLTPGHEKEEVIFYGNRFSGHYISKAYYSPEMKDVLQLYIKKAWKLRQYSLCLKMYVHFLLGRMKYGRYIFSILFRLEHPTQIPRDFVRIWHWTQRHYRPFFALHGR